MTKPTLGESLIKFTEWHIEKWVLYAQCSKGRIECSLDGAVRVIQTHNDDERGGEYTTTEYKGTSLLEALRAYTYFGGELC